MPTNQHRSLAYVYLVLTTAIWGSLYVVTRYVMKSVPPITVLMVRDALASAVLFSLLRFRKPVAGRRGRIERIDWPSFLFIGVVGYFISISAQNLGTKYAGASVASLINAMNPVAITIAAVLILREKLTMHKAIAAAAAVVGAYLILGGAKGGGSVVGIGFSLLSVFFWSISSVFVRRLTQKYDPVFVTAWTIAIAGACTVPVSVFEIVWLPHGKILTLPNILCLLYLGLGCTALPSVLWNKSLSMLEASTCSLFYPIQPLVSVSLGVLLLGETIDLNFIAGALLIVGGVVYAVAGGKKE